VSEVPEPDALPDVPPVPLTLVEPETLVSDEVEAEPDTLVPGV
jgi:hypothetical protein